MKFCLKSTSLGYMSYHDAVMQYPVLGEEQYKMYMTRVVGKSPADNMSNQYDVLYITISSMKLMKELIERLGCDLIISEPNTWRDAKHLELEIYDDYRE